jgi:hypothetical protein
MWGYRSSPFDIGETASILAAKEDQLGQEE